MNQTLEVWDLGPIEENFEKNQEFYLNYGMFQIRHSSKFTWKSFEDKLWYLCSRNKTNRIKESKGVQNKRAFSTLMKFDLSVQKKERIILTSLAKLALQLLLISDFFVKVTIVF